MCRTSACRAGLLLRRACRREKARVSSVHIARLPGKRETPVLCCHDLWTRVQWLIKGGMLFGYAMSVPPATFSMSSDLRIAFFPPPPFSSSKIGVTGFYQYLRLELERSHRVVRKHREFELAAVDLKQRSEIENRRSQKPKLVAPQSEFSLVE